MYANRLPDKFEGSHRRLQVRRIYVDRESSSEVMYEQCFRNLGPDTKAKLRESRVPLVGFSGEVNYPLRLEMEFTIVKFHTPYNVILGRTGMRRLGVHPDKAGPSLPLEKEIALDKREGEPIEAPTKNKPLEKVTVNDDHSDQPITIGGNLSTWCQAKLIKVLRKHADAFTWVPADMTGIPHFVAKHELKAYPYIEPRVQRKRSIALDRRKVVKEVIEEWLKSRIVKKVRYPTWVANLVLVKKAYGSWRMCIDFKDSKKASLRTCKFEAKSQKCSFGMEKGKFLGYIVASEGIRANPEKAKAMAATAQNTNNTTIRSIPLAEKHTSTAILGLFLVAYLMLSSMSPDLQRILEKYNAYDMLNELKTMFEELAKQELFETVKAFHSCKQMGKTLAALHAIMKLHEKGEKGKGKGKNKLAYDPKPKIPPPPKREHPEKDSICHHCKEVGHWRRNCPSYHAELKKRKNASVASTSGIFTIKLYDFPNKT
ncbi:reverse transcriptase domain-containing protein [Tanacetum coccineum]